MLEWTALQLAELDLLLDPDRLSETLRERALFPELDSLDDPLGEPIGRRIWGGCRSLRHVNAL